MPHDVFQAFAALTSGALIGAILSLLGAGGSILAVPLLVFFVGVHDPHTAIGTGAAAVAANALIALWRHALRKNVRWPCGFVFLATGIVGAFLGTLLGKAIDGQSLLVIFGFVMVVVGLTSLRGGPEGALAYTVRMTRENAPQMAPRLAGAGFGVGAASGFFGIGGGFLIVPGLMAAAGLPMSVAMGTSLVAVSAFGLTALASYASSGFVDWPIAGLMTLGGALGAVIGGFGAQALAARRKALTLIFAGVVIATGVYVAWRGLVGMG
ncbi:MAG: sulfite exporter TauE/SafE family protein [Caulobacterales bacterium]